MIPDYIEIDSGPGGIVITCWRCSLFDFIANGIKLRRMRQLEDAFALKHATCQPRVSPALDVRAELSPPRCSSG